MKRILCTVLLGLALAGCENPPAGAPGGDVPGGGSMPSIGNGAFALDIIDKAQLAATDGKPFTELLATISMIVGRGSGPVKKDQLITALDQAFEVNCHEICEIKER